MDEDYHSFVSLVHEKAEQIIHKKQICRHSKGWWNQDLSRLSQDFKKAKWRFAKTSDEANKRKLVEVSNAFKEKEVRARNQYLEGMVKLMDPRKPEQFWKIVNKERKSTNKSVVQPICREDGSLAVSDEEIFIELKKRYGKESLDVKDYDKDWYESVENDVLLKAREHEEEISKLDFKDMCGHENSDLYIEEIEAAISSLNNNSAPSREECIFNILIKKGGESMARALHFIFQKSWSSGVIPDAFKIDPKGMMPKPEKSDYNILRAYRPITLESVIRKVMERVICKRLTWKLEVVGGLAATQYAYRKQKSCVQSMVRLCNSVTEARNKKQHTILTVMDFESCYERIWRASLLRKASNRGISGRMWLYIKNFVTERKYYIRVNNYKSDLYQSTVGIPQGSVISPVLYIYILVTLLMRYVVIMQNMPMILECGQVINQLKLLQR